ncbi:NAD(P)H-dependent oxidoreductase [Carboxylicivirga sp. A043]|uniref:glutathione-regulated potassium-efflux system oxidoreductase KefF n=1 Tax=Carboxylicivirga litoralis TaxID=2816963 RepID=UPI0021CB2238|nr:NAD(P)H-dependent oxidoreductase [Carboxylicivirga sp. A043]MCU4156762.1 NAD(P)H-dependent oxidoreductase [Carboxylicivirga sp. A043]
MKKILIIFAHPMEQKSRVNKELIEAVADMEHVTVNNLYERYPDFFIDVKYEQGLLLKHDVIIWHHPFYWYSSPALLKEWFDLVLEHGFAYGKDAFALKGKQVMNCITTGGRESTYAPGGLNRYPITDYLLPFKQSAYLCKMNYLPPFVVHGVHLLTEDEIENYKKEYQQLMMSLRNNN